MNSLKNLKAQLEKVNETGIINLSKKGVELPENATTCEIMQGIEQITGGASFNIHYGEEAPEDTSMLWIKAEEPDKLIFRKDIDGVGSVALLDTYLSEKSYQMSSAEIGTRIYLFGGYNQSTSSDKISVFDTETQELKTLSVRLPIARCQMGCGAVGNKIYLFGGYDAEGNDSSTITVFDAQTETVTDLETTLNYSLRMMSCAVVGEKIYMFGGYINGRAYTNQIIEFDTATETCTVLSAVLQQKRCEAGCVAVGNKIYLTGGYNSNGYLSDIEVFDTQTELTELLSAELPVATKGMGCAATGDKIYIFGGTTSGGYSDSIYVLDTQENTLTRLSETLLQNCYSPGCVAAGNKIYLFGGVNSASGCLNTIYAYTVTHGLSEGSIELQTSYYNNVFKFINTNAATVEIGVENVFAGNENNEAENAEAYVYKHFKESKLNKCFTYYCAETTSGTTLTTSVDCTVGDLVIAAIITRDTLTLSDGWTLISTSELNSSDSNNQRISFAYKYAESTTESITVTQASSKRIYINMIALQGATGFVDNGYTYADSTSSSSITAEKPEGLVIWACSTPTWTTTTPYPQWESSNDAFRIDLGTDTQSRLAVFLDQTEDTEVTFTPPVTNTITVGSLTIEGPEVFYTTEVKEWDEWTRI